MPINDYLGKYSVKKTHSRAQQLLLDLAEHPIRLSFVLYTGYLHINSAFNRTNEVHASIEMLKYFAEIYKDTLSRLDELGYDPDNQPLKNLLHPKFEVSLSYHGYVQQGLENQEALQAPYQKVIESLKVQYPAMTLDHDPTYLWGESLVLTPFEHYSIILVCPRDQQFKYQLKADENSGFERLPELHEKMLTTVPTNFGRSIDFSFSDLQALFHMDVHECYLKQKKLQPNSLLAL